MTTEQILDYFKKREQEMRENPVKHIPRNYVEECIELQKEYCVKIKSPYFAPRDGVCWSCKHIIFGTDSNQYTKEVAAKTLITGCPKCFRTYCD